MMGESIVLVITPSPDITNKIQQALDDIGGYLVITSSKPQDILELALKSTINACILDIFHPDFPALTLVKELKNKQPQMRLILILSNHGLTHQDLSGIIPDGFLPRSFNTGQLISALGNAPKVINKIEPSTPQPSHSIPNSSKPQSTQDPNPPNPPPFSRMEDFTNLNKRLSNLSMETTAEAVIILRRKQMISHVGKFPHAAIQELIELINSYSRISAQNLLKEILPGYSKSGDGDMIRFIQLQSIKGKYLLYVVTLTKEMLLALVFDQDTLFSNVRRQTKQIARELLTSQQEAPLEYHPAYPETGKQGPSQPTELAQSVNIFESTKNQPTPSMVEPQAESLPVSIKSSSLSETKSPESEKEENGSIFLPDGITSEIGVDKTGIEPTSLEQGEKIGYYDSNNLDEQVEGVPLDIIPTRKEQPSQRDSGYESNSGLASSSYGHYISYSCLLIPRMPQHLLTSTLVSYLFKWMGQLCLAYGWRLEHLSIHSNYIQMIAGAPLTISPAYLVRTLRQKTSQYIFTQFPPLTNENPSGDFWAPGFFISGGRQTVQPHLIDQYISEIRDHQGVYNTTSN